MNCTTSPDTLLDYDLYIIKRFLLALKGQFLCRPSNIHFDTTLLVEVEYLQNFHSHLHTCLDEKQPRAWHDHIVWTCLLIEPRSPALCHYTAQAATSFDGAENIITDPSPKHKNLVATNVSELREKSARSVTALTFLVFKLTNQTHTPSTETQSTPVSLDAFQSSSKDESTAAEPLQHSMLKCVRMVSRDTLQTYTGIALA